MSSTGPGTGEQRLAVLASWVVLAVVTAQGTLSMILQDSTELTPATRTLGVVGVLGTGAAYLVLQRAAVRGRPVPPGLAPLGAVCGTAAFVVGAWLGCAVAVAVVGLATSRWVRVGLVLALGGGLVAVAVVLGEHPVNATFYAVTALAVGVVLIVLTRLAVTVRELARARETVARLRVDEERHRIARDLHDVLGRTLVAGAVRTQAALRLVDDPVRVREQLEEVERTLVDGRSRLSTLTLDGGPSTLAEEVALAEELLDRLGVRCTVTLPADAVPPAVDALAARVVRESVTNALRHARPAWVEVGLARSAGDGGAPGWRLTVTNDGTDDRGHPESGPASPPPSGGGTGLADLTARACALGGTLVADRPARGRYRVVLTLPAGDHTPEDRA